MKGKTLPFSKEKIEEIIEKYPTPFHIYDEKRMIEYAQYFNKCFDWNKGFKEYYAIKSLSQPLSDEDIKKPGICID
jgi:diaminopimelate decarboxylase